MKVDEVGEYVVTVPFVRVIRVKKRIPKDVSVLWILQAVELIEKDSFFPRRSGYIIEDNLQGNLLDVFKLIYIFLFVLKVLHNERNLGFNIFR